MFNLIKKAIISTLLILSVNYTFAQSYSIQNVLKVRTRGTGAIIKDNIVTGYYTFYELDKKDKKTRVYQLNILDQNLSPLSSKKFSSQEDLLALEASYNGDLLMIKFLDLKEDKYSLKTYNENAEQVSSKVLDAKKIFDSQMNKNSDEEPETSTLTPIEGKGFVHFVSKRRKGVFSHTYNEITFIPNSKEVKGWTWQTSENTENFEFGECLGVSNNILLCLIHKYQKAITSDIDEYLMGIDINTGKKLFDKIIEDKKHPVSAIDAVSNNNGSFQLFGYYFEPDAKVLKAKPLGFFGFTVDSTGKIVNRKYESWQKDVSKFLKVSDKGKIEDVGYLYFHKFLKTSDNKIFGIAEQYKTNTGASIGLSMLAGRTSTNIKIGDIFMFEFDETFDLKNVQIFDKSSNSVTFPFITMGVRATGYALKAFDAFDYIFTQVNKDVSKFTVGFVDYSKEKGDKGWYFGSINYSDGKFSTDKVKFDKKATWQQVYPGKPGYVMVSEYFKKEKKLTFRMEKVNF